MNSIDDKTVDLIRNHIKKPEAEIEHQSNELHQYCRLVDKYIKLDFPRNEAIEMAKSVMYNQVRK